MKSEIKIRQKRLLVWILVMALLWNHTVPAIVQAADYTLSSGEIGVSDGQILSPGDTMSSPADNTYSVITITYYDAIDETTQKSAWLRDVNLNPGNSYTVMSYADVFLPDDSGTIPETSAVLNENTFGAWKVTYVYGSGESLAINLTAVPKYTITYNLNGGTNAEENPDSYIEGVGTESLFAPSRTGYDFVGWYDNADFSGDGLKYISENQTGDITLYAKWTAKSYAITYRDSDGNALEINDTNPTTYTYGIGVSDLGTVAEKEGYTFAGWYADAEFTTKVESISTTQTGDIVVYARYTANTYTITYELDGGTNVEDNPLQYTYGVGVEKLFEASKEGHTFEGWYIDADRTEVVEGIGAEQLGDITLYAGFIVDIYSIVYKDSNGSVLEVNSDTNPVEYIYGEGVSSLGTVEKEGYTFIGWYTEAEGGTKVESISTTQTGDVVVYARYTANTYDITYELDGGTNGEGNPNSYTYGEGVKAFADAIKPGHTFNGWYLDAEYTKAATSIDATQMGEVTLYAKFTPNTYKISYVLNGGTNADGNPTEYVYGVGVLDFAEASKLGYTFAGWYADAEFTTKVEGINQEAMQDMTMYAKFIANVYAIQYELAGGTNAESNPAEYTYGIGVEVLGDASKEGHTFEGWYIDADHTEVVESIGTEQLGDITLYAEFTVSTYNITYKDSDGSELEINDTNPIDYTYGEGVSNLGTIEKEGYTFIGWYTEAEGGTRVESISTTQTGDVTLYARFTPNTYVINYELDGGENAEGNPVEYTYGVGVEKLLEASKEGHTFEGWYRDADRTEVVESIGIDQIGDITLYAKFTVDTYQISYVLDGGTNSEDNPLQYTYGVGVEKLFEASKEGHTFEGWYSDADHTEVVESIGAEQLGSVILYAKFTANTYGIIYKDSDGTELEVNSDTNPAEYTYGVGVSSLGSVEKEGYTFIGLYTEAEGGTKVESISTTQTGDVVVYARYTANTYDITYELDGGTNGDGNPNSYTYGEGVKAFADAIKPGHTFNGWYLDAEYTKAATSIDATQMGEVTLYAKFTPNTYKISYVLNGGTNADGNPTEYVYGVGVLDFAEASRLGYTFAGWYADAEFTTKVEGINQETMQDMTLYAKFTANIYKIQYELAGGTNAESNPAEYTYGVGVEVLGDASKEGHTFEGWYIDADHTEVVESIGTEQLGDITLYAQFTVSTYNITYKDSDGSELEINDTNPVDYTYGEGVSNLGTIEKEGYTFIGWYTEAEGGTKVESISTTQTGDVTLYARFTPNTYVINYELDGGENAEGNPVEYTYGIGVEVLGEASKEGHTFEGWYSDAEYTEVVESISTTQIGDITLYAKWTKVVEEPTPEVPDEDVSFIETILIEEGSLLSLKVGVTYTFGSGSWKVTGDDTVYAGGVNFYVVEDTDCEFVKQ